jgi:DNA invertase Pin-like site-specific DNA recombinase
MARISKGQLEKLQKKYKTDDAIGKLFRISRQAVHQLRVKYGIDPVENKNALRDRELLAHYRQGVSGIKLARKFKLSISQVYRIINLQKGKNGKRK